MNISSLNQKLALLGIGIILVTLMVALTFPDGYKEVNKQPNFIGVVELAEKIRSREDFTLIDLRDTASYEEFHLPTAQLIPLEEFSLKSQVGKVICYSGDDLLARRLWDSLSKSERERTFILYGGVRDWFDYLLYPTLPYGEAVSDPVLLNRIHKLCEFYSGFADFEKDPALMDYYNLDLTRAPWPKVQRSGSLVRKGC